MAFEIRRGGSKWWAAIFALILAQALAAEAADSRGVSDHPAVRYPTKTIRLLVTNSAGSGSDVVARLVALKLSDALGQQVVVDNRPGAGGNIGGEIAAKAAPDGYTLMLVTSSNAISTALFKKLNYDLQNDFAPVTLLGTAPFILVGSHSFPATSVPDLIALAKSMPGKLNYASSGTGSAVHLAGEMFKSMSGTNMVHIPYKGLGPALTDVMGGQVQLAFAVTTAVTPLIKAGRVKAFGVTSLERSPLAPDLPAIAESVPGYEAIGWYGVLAPAGTPRALIAKLNGELKKAFSTTESREQLSARGATPMTTTAADFRAFIERKVEDYRRAVRVSGMRVE